MAALGYRLRIRILSPTLLACCALQFFSFPQICAIYHVAAAGPGTLDTAGAGVDGGLLGCWAELSALLVTFGFVAPIAIVYILKARTRKAWLRESQEYGPPSAIGAT